MNTIKHGILAMAIIATILTGLVSITSPVSAEGENVESYSEEQCDPVVDATCTDEDLFVENELRIDWGLAPGRGGCPSLDTVQNAAEIEMIEEGVAEANVENLSGCLFVVEAYGDPFMFTCATDLYCTADRGSVNVTIVGDGTRFEGAERVSFYGNVAYEDSCTYLAHELAYAQLHDLTIVAFQGNDQFGSCEGVEIDEQTSVVSLDDVANGSASNGDSDVVLESTNSCPSSPAEAAELLGGDVSNWSELDEDSWKFKGTKGTNVSLSYPDSGTFDGWVDGGAQEGLTVDVSVDEATYNC